MWPIFYVSRDYRAYSGTDTTIMMTNTDILRQWLGPVGEHYFPWLSQNDNNYLNLCALIEGISRGEPFVYKNASSIAPCLGCTMKALSEGLTLSFAPRII